MRWIKRLLKIIGWSVGGVLVGILLSVLFLQTRFGKNTVVSLVESQSKKFLNGSIEVEQLRGNIFRHLTLSGLTVKDSKNRVVAEIANVVTEFELASVWPLRLILSKVQIEQPRLKMIVDRNGNNWASLVKKSETAEEEVQQPTGKSVVWLQNIKVIGGHFIYVEKGIVRSTISSIDADFFLPETFERLPIGSLQAAGGWKGLPFTLSLALAAPDPNANSMLLSAIAKVPGQDKRKIELQSKLGKSVLRIDGQGDFNLSNWADSIGVISLNKFHYSAPEMTNRVPGLPRQSIDARAYAKTRNQKMDFGLEAHIEKSGKIYFEGSQKSVPQAQRITLNKFRFDGTCPLLEMKKATTLTLKEGSVLPIGNLLLSGCGGTIDYRHPGQALWASIKELRPSRFLDALSIPIERKDLGVISATTNLPQALKKSNGSLDLNWKLPKDQRAQTEGEIKLTAKASGADLNSKVDVQLSEQSVVGDVLLSGIFKGRGWTPTPKLAHVRADVKTIDFDLSTLRQLGLLESSILGRLTANLKLTGSLEKTNVDLHAEGKNIATSDRPKARTEPKDGIVNFNADLSYDSTQARLKALVVPSSLPNSSPLEVVGEVRLPQAKLKKNSATAIKNASFKVVAKTNFFPVSELLPQSAKTSLQARSRTLTSFYAEAEGTMDHIKAVSNLTLDDASGRLVSLSAELDDQELKAHLKSKGAPLDRIIDAFVPPIKLERSRLDADFYIGGKLSKLQYRGYIAAKVATLRIPQFGTSYRKVELTLEGDQNLIRLQNLSAQSGDGSLKAKGTLTLEKGKEPEAITLRGELKNFDLLSSEQMNLQSSGILNLVANRNTAKFNGSFNLDEGTISIPEKSGKNALESVGELEDVLYRETKVAEQKNFLERLQGTIHVNAPGKLWVKSSTDMRIELAAQLDVGLAENSKAFITGEVEARRGYAEFLGRRFEINQATVMFQGDPSVPRLDAQAVYRAPERNIVVDLNGDPEDMKIKLSSDPPGYSEDESIGVLLTGSPDFQGQGGGSTDASSRVGSVVGGYLSGLAKKKLGDKLPFDTLTADLGSGTSQGSARTGTTPRQDEFYAQGRTRIEVGKYLSDRIFVKLGRAFASKDNEPVNRLVLDYRLSDKWSLETSQTDRGRSDFEVQWTLNY